MDSIAVTLRPALLTGVCSALLASCGADEAPSGDDGAHPGGADGSEWFRERLAGSGVDFVHHTGGCGRKYLVENMSSGLSLLDHDGDGDLDLFLCQGAPLPGLEEGAMDARDRLYRNEGDFTFTDVTEASRAGDTTYTFSASCPDLDSDGDSDLYLANFGSNRYQRNDGGVFLDATEGSGLAVEGWSVVSAWADFDRDGDLDVYVCNYVRDALTKQGCDNGRGAAYRTFCNPDEFPGELDRLLRNDGGTFADVTVAAGLGAADSSGLGVAPSDLDDDGDVDLFVCNDGRPNFLWRNDGDLKFVDVAFEAGVSVAANGLSEACMGVDAGDVDGDGDFDLFLTNLTGETNALYRNQGALAFDDHRVLTGLGPPSFPYAGFGCELFDADHDGDLDAIVSNGHVIDNPSLLDAGTSVRQPPLLFRNDGGVYALLGSEAGSYFRGAYVGRGLATGDLDQDGDLDVAISHNDAAPALLENRCRGPHHWIAFHLVGRPGNRQALGAKVTVTAAGRRQIEELRGTSSYCAWQDLRLHFGLGVATRVEAVEVRWPTGRTSRSTDLGVDTVHVLAEP